MSSLIKQLEHFVSTLSLINWLPTIQLPRRPFSQPPPQPSTCQSLQGKPLIPPVLPPCRGEIERVYYIRKSPFGDRPYYGPSIGSLGFFLFLFCSWGWVWTRTDDRNATDCISWGYVKDDDASSSKANGGGNGAVATKQTKN